MAGLVEESLYENGTITKGRLGFGDSTLKRLLKVLSGSHNSHSTTSSAHGGLDDNWETMLLDESIGQIVTCDSTLCTRNNWNTTLDS
jgi:hypothetical protein